MPKRTKEERAIHAALVERYRYVEGKEKPCKMCEEAFIPRARPRENGAGYATGLFCSETCSDDYIRARVKEMGAPRAVQSLDFKKERIVKREPRGKGKSKRTSDNVAA